MLKAALLWYKTFRKDLKNIRFIFYPYNPCVANKTVHKDHNRQFCFMWTI
jgi:hypothetical protein